MFYISASEEKHNYEIYCKYYVYIYSIYVCIYPLHLKAKLYEISFICLSPSSELTQEFKSERDFKISDI